jgi:hypothetical protein
MVMVDFHHHNHGLDIDRQRRRRRRRGGWGLEIKKIACDPTKKSRMGREGKVTES